MGLLSKLDFVIHSDEAILKPTQKTEFLGFAIDSVWLFHWLVKRWKAKICYTKNQKMFSIKKSLLFKENAGNFKAKKKQQKL